MQKTHSPTEVVFSIWSNSKLEVTITHCNERPQWYIITELENSIKSWPSRVLLSETDLQPSNHQDSKVHTAAITIKMFPSHLLLSFFPLTALATVNGHCSGKATGDYDTYGICITTSNCNSYGGSYISGGCPNDVANVKCCLVGLGGSLDENPCGGSSYCSWNDLSCVGSYKPGM